ncbi:pentapeptide repeat-containing protein [Streptomyces zagrosensis]|uniref:Uncharacterized protein YjbI with pentapeptide repeats n=1 Tax=Streptomyces zagrosensis TaxID=1042984 RepID=A0A7W9V1G6_9ACTN|nr:pentapeptide repeat-containing protein [Streptomyces zagrosensis]MBB5938221.1 uncharacterized protein YjbI with pentapeptide repeats [Streptomyces zagrosensis]
MAAIPSRRSGRAARLRRVARRRTRTAPRRASAPIGSRPAGRRRRTPEPTPSTPQTVVAAPTDGWTRLQQAAGTLAALGTLAVIVFTWLSLQQVDNEHALTREGQVTDRYNNAVGNIGEDALEVRLGGIYALQRIMEDSPRDQPSIVNVLSTYIRNHAKKPKQAAGAANQEPASDVQAALTALDSRDRAHDGTENVNLTHAYLAGAHLEGADLTDAKLAGADLTDANLNFADLTNANLEGAHLTRAYLADANLTDANLEGAHLTETNLSEASLTAASLTDANLTDANLDFADLAGAYLPGANLEGAYLEGADLTDADLPGADLTDADLTDADLTGTDLTGAKW